MITSNIESVQQFISCNKVKRADGNILFDAEVKYYTGDTLQKITSQVQLIVLPGETAVYILEFLKEEYNKTEMYNTSHYHFTCTASNALEIRENNSQGPFLLSIMPL